MSSKLAIPMLSAMFLDDFLNRASNEAASVFSSTPRYAELEQQRASWDSVLETLDEAVVEKYKNAVDDAFVHYKQFLEDYSWTMGMIKTIEQYAKNNVSPSQQGSTPRAVTAAENRLQQICRQFIEGLNPEHRENCERYFLFRKASIDIGSAYCIRHGMEFASELLKRVGLTSGGNNSGSIETHAI